MSDPRTIWLTITNILLGLVVVVLLAGVFTGVICDLVSRMRKRRTAMREVEHDMEQYFGHSAHRK